MRNLGLVLTCLCLTACGPTGRAPNADLGSPDTVGTVDGQGPAADHSFGTERFPLPDVRADRPTKPTEAGARGEPPVAGERSTSDGPRLDSGAPVDGAAKGDSPLAKPDSPAKAIDATPADTLFTPFDAPLGTACNVVSQTGCIGPKPKCTLLNIGGGVLQAGCYYDGTVAEGAACTPTIGDPSIDGCIKGTICISGVCTRFCDTNGMCTVKTGGLCNIAVKGATPDAYVCDYPTKCDPLAQDCPSGSGTSCYWQPGTTYGYCYGTGMNKVGTSCTYVNDCVPYADCLASSATTTSCVQNCRVGGAAPKCTTGTCASVGSDPVGVCR